MAKIRDQSQQGGTATAEQFEPIDPRTVAPQGVATITPATAPPAKGEPGTVMLEVPVAASSGYAVRHIERPLGVFDAETLRDVAEGLHAERAKLTDGRIVQTPHDALSWILQQVRASRQ